jgi:hypothetical protein
VSGRIVFFQESDGNALSPNSRVLVLRSKQSIACYLTGVAQVHLWSGIPFESPTKHLLHLTTIATVRDLEWHEGVEGMRGMADSFSPQKYSTARAAWRASCQP